MSASDLLVKAEALAARARNIDPEARRQEREKAEAARRKKEAAEEAERLRKLEAEIEESGKGIRHELETRLSAANTHIEALNGKVSSLGQQNIELMSAVELLLVTQSDLADKLDMVVADAPIAPLDAGPVEPSIPIEDQIDPLAEWGGRIQKIERELGQAFAGLNELSAVVLPEFTDALTEDPAAVAELETLLGTLNEEPWPYVIAGRGGAFTISRAPSDEAMRRFAEAVANSEILRAADITPQIIGFYRDGESGEYAFRWRYWSSFRGTVPAVQHVIAGDRDDIDPELGSVAALRVEAEG